MAVAVTPLANQAHMLLLSPTATTTALTGVKDYFLRVVSATSEFALQSANYHYQQQGTRRTAVVYDLNNRAYAESWMQDYRSAFESLGGQIEPVISYKSNNQVHFAGLVDQVVSSAPDSVLIIANSVDAATLAQMLRQKNAAIRINVSEWAATERLIELGGKSVEGIVLAQFIDRNSSDPGYKAFRKAFLDRFGQEPGFAGLTGFDAANVIIEALADRKSDQHLRDVILQKSHFKGAQSELVFDASGDTHRETFLMTIRDGKYVRL
jgi:branched-chain amino acid transport system substrate-binding protein